MQRVLIFTFPLLISLFALSQTALPKKEYTAIRVSSPPKIDGLLDDSCWMSVAVAADFIQAEPNPGLPSRQKTEVKVVYDNNAVYIGAMMYDTHPDSILCELSKHDNVFFGPNADAFGLLIDAYGDGQNGVFLGVTSCNVQTDTKVADPEMFDDSWNVAWESKVKITDKGWIAEFRIPYSILRFPKKEVQEWGINFSRQIRRYREFSNWTFVNYEIQGIIHQSGILKGISNIESPLRLSFSPYVSSAVNMYDGSSSYSFNGGADVKYGINESFTMDMTLIPDFAQVRSDDKVLNLSPFETYYDEQRPFFNEGTELFNRAGLFYSRRIGGEPMGFKNPYYETDSNEIVEKNPPSTQLYNATKISGRTKSKLGIGFFNAVTAPAYAAIVDTISGVSRKIVTQPLANYNVFVLDQGFKNNSFISVVNTNVMRSGDTYDANVSGTQFRFSDKKNIFAVTGAGAVSQILESDSTSLGGHYKISFAKISGNYTVNLSERVIGKNFNPNDLGYADKTNELAHFLNQSYNIYKPFWIINKMTNDLGIDYYRLATPGKFAKLNIDWSTGVDFKNYFKLGFTCGIRPVKYYDFYEPRVDGRYYQMPTCYDFGTYFSSDGRKRLQFSGKISDMPFNQRKRNKLSLIAESRFRFNDKFNMSYFFDSETHRDDVGWAGNVDDTIIFGVRDRKDFVNTLDANYIFTSTMSLSFRARHYWSQVEYTDYFALSENGKEDAISYTGNNDINFNAVTVDMIYTWQFAPASELSFVWKNAIFTEGQQLINNYFDNFNKTFESPQLNSFSIKILYYLDYQNLKRKKK